MRNTLLMAGLLGLAVFARAQEPRPSEPAPRPLPFPGAEIFNEKPPFLTGVSVNHSDGLYREGDILQIKFQAERESHLYLLYHQADGTSLLLFPNEAHPDSRTPATKAIIVPPAGEDFRFRIRPPHGREVLQAIASTQPIARFEKLVQKTGRAALVPADLFAKAREDLRAAADTWTEHRVPITTVAKEAVPPMREAVRIGLFIGIGKYQNGKICKPHEELRHSAEVMHDLMLKHGGLDAKRTKLVRDHEATRKNLEQLIVGWLPEVSQPGDTVFIYFSGHAGSLDTTDPSEVDGKDETIAPFDVDGFHPGDTVPQALARARQTSITDDTLARWLQELNGRQVVLILDTCHSGGVVEGKSLDKSLFDEAVRVKDINQLNMIVLTSCAGDEQALFEGTPDKTMYFTFCLAEAITSCAGKQKLSVQQAYAYTHKRMRVLLREANAPREQEPQLFDRSLLPVLLVQ